MSHHYFLDMVFMRNRQWIQTQLDEQVVFSYLALAEHEYSTRREVGGGWPDRWPVCYIFCIALCSCIDKEHGCQVMLVELGLLRSNSHEIVLCCSCNIISLHLVCITKIVTGIFYTALYILAVAFAFATWNCILNHWFESIIILISLFPSVHISRDEGEGTFINHLQKMAIAMTMFWNQPKSADLK